MRKSAGTFGGGASIGLAAGAWFVVTAACGGSRGVRDTGAATDEVRGRSDSGTCTLVATTDSDDCDFCLQERCCSSFNGCFDEEPCRDLVACQVDCESRASGDPVRCISDCEDTYAKGRALRRTFESCLAKHCPSECGSAS